MGKPRLANRGLQRAQSPEPRGPGPLSGQPALWYARVDAQPDARQWERSQRPHTGLPDWRRENAASATPPSFLSLLASTHPVRFVLHDECVVPRLVYIDAADRRALLAELGSFHDARLAERHLP